MTSLRHFTRTPILAEEAKGKDLREIQGIHTLLAPTRVKRCVIGPNGRELRFVDKRSPERGANKGDIGMGFESILPQGEL